MASQEAASLKQLFQSMCQDSVGVVEGIVTSVSPLQVTLANDAKMVLGENTVIVPRRFTDYTVMAGTPGKERTQITIYQSLQQGERVYLLSFHNKKKYYILGRKG